MKPLIEFGRVGQDGLLRDGTIELVACSKKGCGRVYRARDRLLAENCCTPRICSHCGSARDNTYAYTVCDPCRHLKDDIREMERVIAATRVMCPANASVGPLHDADADRWYRDDEDWFEDAEDRVMRYAWLCDIVTPNLDTASFLENALDETPDETDADWVDEEELHAFVKAWAEKQTINWWEPDYSHVLLAEGFDPAAELARLEAELSARAAPRAAPKMTVAEAPAEVLAVEGDEHAPV